MKKKDIGSITMEDLNMKKNLLYTAFALLACWACAKQTEIDTPTPQEKPQEQEAVEGHTHTATLSFGTESDDQAVKGTFVPGFDGHLKFEWQEGDQIGVYLYSNTLQNVPGAYNVSGQYGPWIAPFDLISGAGTGTATFRRELNDDLGETYGNVAIYPNTPGSSFAYSSDETKGTLTYCLPDMYTDLTQLDTVRMPMVAVLDMSGEGDKHDFTLKHVGGAVKITLKNVPAGAKYFKLWAVGQNISGKFTINLSAVGTGTLSYASDGKNTVELQLKEGVAREELDVYFPVPAGEYTLGIGVYGDNVTYLDKTASRANTIGRGKILRMPAITLEDYVPPTPNLGAYVADEFDAYPSHKAAGITYQMNVYSFADSDGDGIGDFPGIVNHLDYLDKLGVTAIWLSPCQLAQSYHGYDVRDYTLLNPVYAGGGTANHTSAAAETAFQTLIDQAHAHNIRIYMDYVMNHTGDEHPWFKDAKANGPSSPYWDYYAISANPYQDVHDNKIPQIPSYWDVDPYNDNRWWPFPYGAGQSQACYAVDLDWTNASAPTITFSDGTGLTLTKDDPNATFNNPERFLNWGNGEYTKFADNGENRYRLVLNFQSNWGCLVRTTDDNNNWADGTKWGFASGKDKVQLGVTKTLTSTNSIDILMPDATLYFYYSAFSTGMMPDLNYYHSAVCETAPAFKAMLSSVDKWLAMGLDGLRLDAIKHIYGDESGGAGSENREFWQKFYNAVNNGGVIIGKNGNNEDITNVGYKGNASNPHRTNLAGTADANIFMVGEVLSDESNCKPFYGGLPAIFEFQFWWDLRTALKNESKGSFVSGLCDRYYGHQTERSNAGQVGPAIATPKLANHDEDRTASELYYRHRIRQAACILLTAPGRPFVYQGEELGYWGEASMGGDEYRRAPILWTTDISSAAIAGVNNKYDAGMLTPAISVASQATDSESILTLYRRFAYARNTNPAMANGHPEYDNKTGRSDMEYCENRNEIMAWYMHENGEGTHTCLVMHNISGSEQTVWRWDGDNVSEETILVASDPIRFNGKQVIMPPYSSVVFALN